MSNKAEKSEVIENILENLSQRMGNPRSEAFKNNTCVICGGSAVEFRDEPSRKEYSLSGMCQVCQDSFFE
mgnify:FL=1